jgi:hypothetical protein
MTFNNKNITGIQVMKFLSRVNNYNTYHLNPSEKIISKSLDDILNTANSVCRN